MPGVVEAAPLGDSGQHGSTGAVRSSAWCGFSSTLNPRARRVQVQADDAGSVGQERVGGDLEGLGAPGRRPKARQICCTLVAEMPTLRASSRLDSAWSLGDLRVRTTTSPTCASVMEGHAGPRPSVSPSRREARTAPPAGDSPAVDAEPGRDRDVARRRRRPADPRPQRQSCAGRRSPVPAAPPSPTGTAQPRIVHQQNARAGEKPPDQIVTKRPRGSQNHDRPHRQPAVPTSAATGGEHTTC